MAAAEKDTKTANGTTRMIRSMVAAIERIQKPAWDNGGGSVCEYAFCSDKSAPDILGIMDWLDRFLGQVYTSLSDRIAFALE
jgi:hypothetical protein